MRKQRSCSWIGDRKHNGIVVMLYLFMLTCVLAAYTHAAVVFINSINKSTLNTECNSLLLFLLDSALFHNFLQPFNTNCATLERYTVPSQGQPQRGTIWFATGLHVPFKTPPFHR